jgi:SAM-dependent methyltransferase
MLSVPLSQGSRKKGVLDAIEVPDYESYDYSKEWRGRRIEDLAEKAIIKKWLVRSDFCLELGGGFGRITQVLLPFFRNVVVVDASSRNTQRLRRRLGLENIVRAEIGSLPFRSRQFDFVVMVRVIHHVPRLKSLFSEIRRVAKQRGTLILSAPNTSTWLRKVTANREVGKGPPGHRIYVAPMSWYASDFAVEGMRGTGIFDNRLGRALNGLGFLHLLDVATSTLWRLKNHVFMKLRID